MEMAGVLLAIVGALGLRELVGVAVARWVNRKAEDATTREVEVRTAAAEVDLMRGLLQDVKDDRAQVQNRLGEVEARVAQLEERERHMLTRAAVHEAWDQITYAAIVAAGSHDHPPPPPLLAEKNPTEEIEK